MEEKKFQCRIIFLAKLLKKDDEKFEKKKIMSCITKKDHKYQNHNQSDHIFKFFISSISVLLLLIISLKLLSRIPRAWSCTLVGQKQSKRMNQVMYRRSSLNEVFALYYLVVFKIYELKKSYKTSWFSIYTYIGSKSTYSTKSRYLTFSILKEKHLQRGKSTKHMWIVLVCAPFP